jgi:hypothetical protein
MNILRLERERERERGIVTTKANGYFNGGSSSRNQYKTNGRFKLAGPTFMGLTYPSWTSSQGMLKISFPIPVSLFYPRISIFISKKTSVNTN